MACTARRSQLSSGTGIVLAQASTGTEPSMFDLEINNWLRPEAHGVSEGGPLADPVCRNLSPTDARRWYFMARFARSSWTTPRDWKLSSDISIMPGAAAGVDRCGRRRIGTIPALQQWWGRFSDWREPGGCHGGRPTHQPNRYQRYPSSVHVPTLVIHCTGDTLINVEHGRFLAEHIAGAARSSCSGTTASSLLICTAQICDAMEDLCGPGSISAAEGDRVLATVLFTEIAGSTARAEQLGDQRCAICSKRDHTTVRRELARFRGNEAEIALATGFSPRSTARHAPSLCACSIAEAVRPLDIQVRSGLHTGEIEIAGNDVHDR